ncbi:MAG TPA: hypothetical protein VFG72_17670 [Marmoricola sp.]|nr:hypothetical protein [Marmoricola sp.]
MTTTAAPPRANTHRTSAPLLPRVALLAPAGLSLLVGLDAALLLLGLPAPLTSDRLPEVHGVLLVLGFVGTLIALERAVALGRPAAFASPALLGLGGLLLVSPAPLSFGRTALLLGAAGLVAVYVPLWRRQRDDAVLIQALGAVLATGAAALWLGGTPVPVLLPWLVGFVVLTICGERVELARFTLPSTGPALLLAVGLVVATVASLLWPTVGHVLFGAVVVGLALWLGSHDAARRTIRSTGLPRFMAGCMLAGYAWLVVAGATWLVVGPVREGGAYDVVLHAVFLGFTLSMVMAHAPVILPAVLRRPLPYHPVLIAPAVLLHLSLALRLWVGDGLEVAAAWRVGGTLNIVAVLAFAGCAGWSAATARRVRSSR